MNTSKTPVKKGICKNFFHQFKLKRSIGFQWRFQGFSFYNFPTAIEVEYHQPLDTFKREINETTISYGENGRAYVKVLFDF